MKKNTIILSALFVFLTAPIVGNAYSDLPIQNNNYKAIEYLSEKKVINGYPDGTFQPRKKVIRAEAIKLILVATEEKLNSSTKHSFKDVPAGVWFEPYVNFGVEKGFIKGDGTTGDFVPERQVNKAEFLKILLEAFGIDPAKNQLNDVNIADVSDEWFAGYIKFAVKHNVIKLDANKKSIPDEFLTRGQCAQIIFNLLESGSGLDPQTLLNITESKLIKGIKALETNDLFAASSNASVAHDFAKITLNFLPNHATVKAAEKTASAVKSLVGAYAAGQNGLTDDVLTASKAAWGFADESQQLNPSHASIAQEIKKLAESMANKARAQ